MKESIRISYRVGPDFRYNLLIVCGGNGCKRVTKDNVELRGYGPSMKTKDYTHHGRVRTSETKEYPVTTARFPFGDMRPPFLKLRLYNVGGRTPCMKGGNNILAGKKVRAAP